MDAFPHSEYREFPRELAEYIREALPELWSKHGTGGNPPTAFTGDRAYKLWGLWLQGDRSPEVVDWAMRRRDAYASRHRRDFRKGGVIAAIKWGVVLPIGVHAMVAELPLEDPEEPVVRDNRPRTRRNANSPPANWCPSCGAPAGYYCNSPKGKALKTPHKARGARNNMNSHDVERARAGDKNLAYANLEGAYLEGADLEGANLKYAKLEGANLTGANLTGADLSGANLKNAYLKNAYLLVADLLGANLKNAYLERANLEGANLKGADLECADLSYANLSYANLSGAHLSATDLSHADLTGADLTHADLQDAILTGTILTDVKRDGFTLWPKGFTPPPDPRRSLSRR